MLANSSPFNRCDLCCKTFARGASDGEGSSNCWVVRPFCIVDLVRFGVAEGDSDLFVNKDVLNNGNLEASAELSLIFCFLAFSRLWHPH